jgi:hypothetical protein
MQSRNGERSDFCYRQARFSWGSSRHLFNRYLEVKRPVFESDDLHLVARLKNALNYFRSPRRRWAQWENFSFAFTFTFRYRLARVLFTPQGFAVTTLDSTPVTNAEDEQDRWKRGASLNLLMTSAAPIVTAGQLLTSSKLGRQKTMTWQVDQWRYRGEKSISVALR